MTTPPLSDFPKTYVGEVNAYVAGFVSVTANTGLIYATSQVKTYSSAFRRIQYYVCALRLMFTMVIVMTSPTLVYIARMKALYIVKGGFYMPFDAGLFFLILFVFFVVISCSSPTVQYLQLCHLLSINGHKESNFGLYTSSISVVAGLPTLLLGFLGYKPSKSELDVAQPIVYYLNGVGDSAFLMVTSSRIGGVDWSSIICTIYILAIMMLSVMTVIVCGIVIQKQMKKKMMSDSAQKLQSQINRILFLQFSLPFLTIHVPFYASFILPMFDIEMPLLSSYLPLLFSWCPAINPILVMIAVKISIQLVAKPNFSTSLKNRKTKETVSSSPPNHFNVQYPTRPKCARPHIVRTHYFENVINQHVSSSPIASMTQQVTRNDFRRNFSELLQQILGIKASFF